MNSFATNPNPNTIAIDFDPFADGEVLLTALATESQKEIWASVQLGDDANCAYNESVSILLRGELEINALRLAFEQLIQRHEALRTTFDPEGQNLCITESPEATFSLVNLSNLNQTQQAQKIVDAKQQAVSVSFDLEHGPLFRIDLFKLESRLHLLILTTHHIVFDGWSWGVIIPELGKLYSAFRLGETPDLEEPDRFSNYALMLEEAESNEDAIATEAYWINKFAQSVPIVDFPTDRPRPPIRTFNAARIDWTLDADLVAALKQLGSTFNCSFLTTMLSSFEVFLARLLKQEELVVGLPAAGQASAGQYQLVGHCVNLLPVRSFVDSKQDFSSYLRSRRAGLLDDLEHQQFTFGSLIKKLTLLRDSSRIPLVSVAFNLDQSLDPDKLVFAGLQVEIASNPRTYENFELFVNGTERNGTLTLECQYNTNLFDAETIERRLAEFETLLRGIVADPNQAIAQLPILPESEQQQLRFWNQTQVEYDQSLLVHQRFEQQAQQLPHTLAVQSGANQISYGELNARANQLANRLVRLGVEPNTLVGICLERSPEFVWAALSILKAGAAYVPLDPNYPLDRLSFMLNDSGVKVLLTQQQYLNQVPISGVEIICLDTDWQNIAQESSGDLPNRTTGDHLAYVIYTSGSTGKPKGVEICHRGLLNLVLWHHQEYQVIPTDRATQIASPAFDASVWELWPYLTAGASLHIPDEDTRGMPSKLATWLASQAITLGFLPTPLAEALLQEPLPANLCLRALLTGGDALRQVPTQALPFNLVNHYGPSENTVVTTWAPVVIGPGHRAAPPIGRPIANTQVCVLDANLQAVPIGVAGELHIRGVGLAKGYLNRPELTNEKFIPDPFSSNPEDRLYKTGDLVRFLADGNLEFLGRIDNQVKIRGFRIEIGEIETILRQYSNLSEVAIVDQDDASGNKQLIAYIVSQPGTEVTPIELRNFLKQHLPDYMVPAVFIPLEKLPLTPSGKIDRRALPEPDIVRSDMNATYVAPRNSTEQRIAEIWQQVLKLERLGIHDNFFDLGGHSLLATQVLSRLRLSLDVDLPLRTFFEVPTIADLAERIETIHWLANSTSDEFSKSNAAFEEGEL